MNVLITGINGFIGRHTAEAFQTCGANITGTDRQVSCHRADVRYIQADLTDFKNLEPLIGMGQYDCIVHLAASLDMKSASVLHINTVGTWHILKLALRTGCRRFLHLSSVPIIGVPPADGPITESTPAMPRTLYHVSKYAAEQLVMLPEFAAIQRYNLRIASPVGPGMPETLLKVMLGAAKAGKPLTLFGTGSRVQNYIDARDVAAAIVKISQTGPQEGLYLLGGESHSNVEAARLCLSVAGKTGKIIFADKPDPSDAECWILDDTKARMEFNYLPGYSLKQSLIDILE